MFGLNLAHLLFSDNIGKKKWAIYKTKMEMGNISTGQQPNNPTIEQNTTDGHP